MGNKNLLTGLIIAVPLLVGGMVIRNAAQPDAATEPTVQQQIVEQPVVEQKPTITISEDGTTVTYEGQDGKTALAILREGAEVGTEESSFGEFVRSIDGRIADEDAEYWAFYVEGEYGAEGAGTYETSDGEKLMWVLENL